MFGSSKVCPAAASWLAAPFSTRMASPVSAHRLTEKALSAGRRGVPGSRSAFRLGFGEPVRRAGEVGQDGGRVGAADGDHRGRELRLGVVLAGAVAALPGQASPSTARAGGGTVHRNIVLVDARRPAAPTQ